MPMATFSYILHLLLLLLLPFPNTCVIASASEPLGFSATLVHKDNPASPLYDPSSSPAQRAQQAILHSRRRSRHLASAFTNNKISSVVGVVSSTHLMKLRIGSPPLPYWLSMDTGSDLTWIACHPCDTCFPDKSLMFDPLQSISYYRQSCTSKNCELVKGECDDNQLCRFKFAYVDQSSIKGILSSETIVFDDHGGRGVAFPNLVIGCVHEESAPHFSLLGQPGLVGLSRSSKSFINQIGSVIHHKFAYCLPPVNTESSGWIKFGRDADQFSGENEVQVISMGQNGNLVNYYTVILEDISVGEDRVHIQWRPPRNPTGDARILILDSGTEFMYLAPYVYDQVKENVDKAVDAEGFISNGQLCYRVAGEDPYEGLPDMTLHFYRADWKLPPSLVFRYVQESGKVCLAIEPQRGFQVGVIGSHAQQNTYIKYDLERSLLYFAPTNCGSTN